MKFGKVLESQAEGFPELHRVFLRYKLLKKKIKAIPHLQLDEEPKCRAAKSTPRQLTNPEQDLLSTLNSELERLNTFFIEQEEVAVIRMQAISELLMQLKLQTVVVKEQFNDIMQQLANFHGELVLLMNWSQINYSAVAKILKKHDKRMKRRIKASFLKNVLQQPFCSTKLLSKLTLRAEELTKEAVALAASVPGTSANCKCEPDVSRRVQQALKTWDSLAKSASTPSTIIVPSVPLVVPIEQDTAPAGQVSGSPGIANSNICPGIHVLDVVGILVLGIAVVPTMFVVF